MGQTVTIELHCDNDRNYTHLFPKKILVPKNKMHTYFYVHKKLMKHIIQKQQHGMLPDKFSYDTMSFWNEENNQECCYTREITQNEVLNVVFGGERIHKLRMKHGHWCNPNYAKWHNEFSEHHIEFIN